LLLGGGTSKKSAADSRAAREYEEDKHPRDESGKWTDGGGGGGGGSSSTGTDKPAAEAKPAAPGGSEAGGEKKKIEIADFAKDEIRLDPGTQSNPDKQKKFVDVWNSRIAEAPAEFRKEFLGGINASMGIRYEEGDDKFVVAGTLKDANGDGIGEYTRTIDFAQKKAISEYFKLDDSARSEHCDVPEAWPRQGAGPRRHRRRRLRVGKIRLRTRARFLA
jgi:hypothetical protein